MRKLKSPLEYAIAMARKIPVSKSQSGKTMQRIYAVCLDEKSRILSESSNMYNKSHPYQFQCAKIAGNEKATMLHAEIAAIVKNRYPNSTIDSIVIARVGNSGEPLLAKPCHICQIAINKANIQNIKYTK